jgi:DNA-binding CsgD family transcriptional regulator
LLKGRRNILERIASVADHGGELFSAQRRLRAALLDEPVVRYKPARDLAAHMLLHIDDLTGCWSIAANWLRAELECHRVDTGFGVQTAADYFPGFAEAKSSDHDVPSFAGKPVDNRDAMMQAMWRDERPLVYADIKHDNRVSIRMRQRMSGAKTRSKIAWSLRTPEGSYGLICADWTEHLVPVQSGIYDCFEQTVADVLSPIISVAKGFSVQISGDAGSGQQPHSGIVGLPDRAGEAAVARLTPSEVEVARLVAKGLSYKEIARIRGRSFSTIDHQLRSIREKTGAISTAALIHLLSRADFG